MNKKRNAVILAIIVVTAIAILTLKQKEPSMSITDSEAIEITKSFVSKYGITLYDKVIS
jgi:hypothetical protein